MDALKRESTKIWHDRLHFFVFSSVKIVRRDPDLIMFLYTYTSCLYIIYNVYTYIPVFSVYANMTL